jgi:hypothetical protein
MYDEMQSWSAKRSQGISEATAASDTFNTAIANVAANVTSGQANLAARAALSRIQKKTAAATGANTAYRPPTSTPPLSATSLANIRYSSSASILGASSTGIISVLTA